ncbi:MAG: amidase [Alphaproteobacteria bacterium]|nr:MAG: amidase [Alphaproteobacteria bacterium]
MSELCDLGAVELRRLIGAKKISPVELLDSCLARIAAVNPALNAMVAMGEERARDEARAAEAAVMNGAALGPLHGLPVGIKDLNATAGLRTTYGSLLYENHVPKTDERLVAAVRSAGAIVLGKTNTPEFGAGANTRNRVYGATGNPFDPTLTCGGSSGGSAVALATGMVPLATGSDFGGSLRTPAGFCGVVGFRPTPGTIPHEVRQIGLTPFPVQGPMGRNVADAALLLSALAGFDRRDPFSRPLDGARFAAPRASDLARLRVAVSEDLGCAPVDNSIRVTFRARVEKLAPLFASCVPRDPDLGPAHDVFEILRGVNFIAAHKARVEKHRDLLGPNVIDNTERALAMSAADVAWASATQTQIYRRFVAFMDEVDILICPACSVPPFPHDEWYPKEINGQTMPTYMRWLAITYGLTLTTHPVAVIPCGVDERGLPFGIQIVGRYQDDAALLGIAQALERALAEDPELARPRPDLARLTR